MKFPKIKKVLKNSLITKKEHFDTNEQRTDESNLTDGKNFVQNLTSTVVSPVEGKPKFPRPKLCKYNSISLRTSEAFSKESFESHKKLFKSTRSLVSPLDVTGSTSDLFCFQKEVCNGYEIDSDAKNTLHTLKERFAGALGASDRVLIMDSWNKVLAFKSSFSEALLNRWKIQVAFHLILQMISSKEYISSDSALNEIKDNALLEATERVEKNNDPITKAFSSRSSLAVDYLMGMIDMAVRELCPLTQVVHREAYHPLNQHSNAFDFDEHEKSFVMECQSMEGYHSTFSMCGIYPGYWLCLIDAFCWAIQTHSPYAEDDEIDDAASKIGAHANFIALSIAKPCIEHLVNLRLSMNSPLYAICIPRFWTRCKANKNNFERIGEQFCLDLLKNYPNVKDYFTNIDVDVLFSHFAGIIDLIVKSIPHLGESGTKYRNVFDKLGEYHRQSNIATFTYSFLGAQILDTLRPLFQEEESLQREDDNSPRKDQMEHAIAFLYKSAYSLTYHPMFVEEKLLKKAGKFLQNVSNELQWPPSKLSKRLWQVRMEVSSTGTYTHTFEELETGARLSWRNSAKCIGRIAWETLVVRDFRHVTSSHLIMREVKNHIKLALAEPHIQSVMTVFKPKHPNETWGTRFWSSQYYRYAAYLNKETGEILGDIANLSLTEYLLEHNLWTPPMVKTQFDLLPLVVKCPGQIFPHVYNIPPELIHEVNIEHPTCPEVGKLGLKWPAIPAISNMKMELGGVSYQCCPFNGWFVSTEIVRNLLERYNLFDELADALKIDKKGSMWKSFVVPHLESSVIHSFQKNNYTIVDPYKVGNSFMTHCSRERMAGRECPAQWSWIGGLTGFTNPTWHKEMRDFHVDPQYEYSCNQWEVTDALHGLQNGRIQTICKNVNSSDIPKVLVAFGSETGGAEAAAVRLFKSLKFCKPIIKCLNDITGLDIIKEKEISHFLIICSTFGNGSPPSNAEKFFKANIQKKSLTLTKIAVLALGSSSYPNFCQAGVDLHRKLKSAGSQQLLDVTKADDLNDGPKTIKEWINLVKRLVLSPSVEDELSQIDEGKNFVINDPEIEWLKASSEEITKVFQEDESKHALCIENNELIEINKSKKHNSTKQIVFRLPSGLTYHSGDHLVIHPVNNIDMVLKFISFFRRELCGSAISKHNPSNVNTIDVTEIMKQKIHQPFTINPPECLEAFPFKVPNTLHNALLQHVSFNLTPPFVCDLIKVLHGKLSSISYKSKILETNGALIKKFYDLSNIILSDNETKSSNVINLIIEKYVNVINLLEKFAPLFFPEKSIQHDDPNANNNVAISLLDILQIMPRMYPRYYSISSSPESSSGVAKITVSVIDYVNCHGINIQGVCSTYLAQLCPQKDKVRISIRTSSFRLPDNIGFPVIMVGAGTGLAPFMGFLEDRKRLVDSLEQDHTKIGECTLFFGCRTANHMLYKKSLDGLQKSGIVKMHVAFSRQTKERKYVQDVIRENGKKVCSMLMNKNCHYYVCGGCDMADDCYKECIAVLQKHGNMSRISAIKKLKILQAEGRWQCDLWGAAQHLRDDDENGEDEKSLFKQSNDLMQTHFSHEAI